MMAVGIAGEKRGAISRMKDFLAAFRSEDNLSLQDVDEFLRQGVPMTLAGPGARLQFEKVDADLLQPCRHRQPMSNFVLTRRVEGFWVSRASRNEDARDIDLLPHSDLR